MINFKKIILVIYIALIAFYIGSGFLLKSTHHTIVYTNAGYSPSMLAIKAGDTVTFINKSSGDIWTTSGPHEDHSDYSGIPMMQHCPDIKNIAFDQCTYGQPQTSWSFTFLKKGTWHYHNHEKDEDTGIVIVK